MTIQRAPHPLFSVLWAAWYTNVVIALALPGHPLYGLGVLVAFLPIELSAVAWENGSRDTLSEIATWLVRKTSRHERVARGWNALLLILILMITYLLGRTIYTYADSWLLAVTIAALATVWLHDHWLSPQVHG